VHATEGIRKIDHELDGLTLDKVDRGTREQVHDRLCSRAKDIPAEMGVPTAIIRETIDLAFIRLQLNRVLKAGTRARGHPLLLVADSGVG